MSVRGREVAQLRILFDAAIRACQMHSERGPWAGLGLRKWLEWDEEESLEWRAEMLKGDETRAIEEAADRIVVMAATMVDSGMLDGGEE